MGETRAVSCAVERSFACRHGRHPGVLPRVRLDTLLFGCWHARRRKRATGEAQPHRPDATRWPRPGYEWHWAAIQNEPDKPIWISGSKPRPSEIDWALQTATRTSCATAAGASQCSATIVYGGAPYQNCGA